MKLPGRISIALLALALSIVFTLAGLVALNSAKSGEARLAAMNRQLSNASGDFARLAQYDANSRFIKQQLDETGKMHRPSLPLGIPSPETVDERHGESDGQWIPVELEYGWGSLRNDMAMAVVSRLADEKSWIVSRVSLRAIDESSSSLSIELQSVELIQ